MDTIRLLLLINFILCTIAVIDMIFVTQKKPERIIAWIILLSVPFVGLFVYLIVGAGLSLFVRRMIKKFKFSTKEYRDYLENQIKILENSGEHKSYPEKYTDLILLNLNTCGGIYSANNDMEYFVDGESAVQSLIKDIKAAKSSIHLEFYIFAYDKIGKEIVKLLTEKAKQGVEVRLLYDAIGSLSNSKINFRKLIKAGGKVSQFFPPFLNIKLLNFKANYRNHRKICVIDGKIAYTGGFNIRDDHLGRVKHLSPWRDTTARFVGGVVHSFQNIFLSDWRFSSKDSNGIRDYQNEKYFPKIRLEDKKSKIPMQVLTSGPDNEGEAIKECIIKMMLMAKKSIKIQTPYFIPDDSFMNAIKLALLSGIEVSIMIPKKIDHWHVHFGNFSYINDLLKFGLKVYVYDGFIHSKVVMVDDEFLTLGSCNIDIRSFKLNFECNVIVYDKTMAIEYASFFDNDIKNSHVYDDDARKKRNVFAKLLTSFCRLFSSLL